MNAAVTALVAEWGGVDVLVNSAGITGISARKTHEIAFADFEHVVRVNLFGSFLAAKAGASLLSPFVGRLDDINEEGMTVIRELVEIVTEYLEGGLSDADRSRFESHVGSCSGCANYVEQIRITIDLAGRVSADDLSAETKSGLLAAFRDWKE